MNYPSLLSSLAFRSFPISLKHLPRRQQKRPGRNRTDLPHIASQTSASTSVVKSRKRLRRLRATDAFQRSISNADDPDIEAQCVHNKFGSKLPRIGAAFFLRRVDPVSLIAIARLPAHPELPARPFHPSEVLCAAVSQGVSAQAGLYASCVAGWREVPG